MASMIPCALEAIKDKRLRGAPREVYFWLHDRMDLRNFRPMTLGRIVMGTGIHRATVHTAVRRLIATGYIERRFGDSRIPEYRLIYSPDEK